MPLKKQKGQRIETRTLRTKLVRKGFDFQLTNDLFSQVTEWFLIQIANDPVGVDESDFKLYYEPRLCTGESSESFPFDIPQLLRRACLAKAVGIYKSWRSNYQNWQTREEKRIARLQNKRCKPMKKHNPPVLPTSLRLNASFYSGMFKEDNGETIMLKLFDGVAWKWIKFRYQSAPEIQGWQKSTGSLIVKRNGSVWFNWVYERYQPATGGIKTLMTDGNRFVSVDTDLDGEICKVAAYDVDVDGEISEIGRMTVKGHRTHTARRKSRIGKIATKMNQTGIISKGFASTKWEEIKRNEREATRQISSQIVKFAVRHGCAVIVFEFLGKLRPQRGKYSRRSNQKRAYWLKSAIQDQVSRTARQYHNILTAKVNPRDTSNTEAISGEKVLRTGDMQLAELLAKNPQIFDSCQRETGYHPGSLAITRSGKIINSGLNACRRIALKFAARYYSKAHLVTGECVGIIYKLPAKVA